jgi:uncharacterized membrane protein YgaE (UPF0421/DUF939 family)
MSHGHRSHHHGHGHSFWGVIAALVVGAFWIFSSIGPGFYVFLLIVAIFIAIHYLEKKHPS